MHSSVTDTTPRSKSDFGVCKALFERLAGSNGDYWRKALVKFLRKEDPFKLDRSSVWREIAVAYTTWTKEELMRPPKKGYKFTEWAAVLAEPLVLPRRSEAVRFVKGGTDELFGIVGCVTPAVDFTPEFLARFNLEPCLETDVFFLRPNYLDQPVGEYATIWSKTMPGKGDRGPEQQLFTLGHHSEQGLLVHVHDMHAGCSEGGGTYIFRLKG
jgi:hypothetical protein